MKSDQRFACVVGAAMLGLVGSVSSLHGQGGQEIIQNAVIEGIQISSEPGGEPGEKTVTCYFIFRDKPSSFFYEQKAQENKIVFEFNDTKKGVSPIASVSEDPLTGFTVEERKIDINKEVRGLNPEWHDLVRVVFDVKMMPVITVNEEYSIISFTYKWSNDPSNVKKYVVGGKKSLVVPLSLAGVGGAGAAFLVWYILKPEPPVARLPLGIDDLPTRPSKK